MSQSSVLVIGSGGREHALSVFLAKSPAVERVYGIPGNAGTELVGERVDLNTANHEEIEKFVREKGIKLTVIGPEVPLLEGLGDYLRAKGHLVVGASAKAAQLEGSKIFAKNFMAKYGIPTAGFRMFDDAAAAKAFAKSQEGRKYRVLKADGLAAGKGVIIARSTDELLRAINDVMVHCKFGEAGSKIILEETLKGPEVSLIALTDGKTLLPLPASQDHKRVFDADKGPNTGGMGAYAPTPFYDDSVRNKVTRDVIENFIRGIQSEGLDFRGIIYFGLMLTDQGPKVLEFNVRFGDPEAQVILPLIDTDIYEVLLELAKGNLMNVRLPIKQESACTIVLASKGYPEKYSTAFPIQGLESAAREEKVLVFHAGTKKSGANVVTNGGRVLNITGLGKTLDMAVVRAYQAVKKISFHNMHFRHDIASKALKNRSITSRVKRMKQRVPEKSLTAV